MLEFMSSWKMAATVLASVAVLVAVGTLLLRGNVTGRRFLAFFSLFFVVIIAVNLFMARNALGTFPGVETANSYVASQQFDDRRAEQEGLGWQVSADVQGTELHVTITDAAGLPVGVQSIEGVFGRATTVRDDQTPVFRFDGQRYVAQVEAGEGYWNLRLEAVAPDGTLFTQRIEVVVVEG